jgi:hypothetical protein
MSMTPEQTTPKEERDTEKLIERVRETVAKMEHARENRPNDVSRQFYLANLEGFLGGLAPGLAEQLARTRAVLADFVEWFDSRYPPDTNTPPGLPLFQLAERARAQSPTTQKGTDGN